MGRTRGEEPENPWGGTLRGLARHIHVPREQLDVSKRTVTHDAYVGVPLADLSSKARGDALEGIV